jgi:hypothetical protein
MLICSPKSNVLTIVVFSAFFHFQSDVIERLRLQHAKDLEKVVYIVFSHQVTSVNCDFLFLFCYT